MKIKPNLKLNKTFQKIYDDCRDFVKNSTDPYFICKNTNLINIFDISWVGLTENFSEVSEYYLFALYWLDAINFELFRSVLQELETNLLLEEEILVYSFWVHSKKKKIKYNYYNFLRFTRKLGVKPQNFSKYAKLTRENISKNILSEKDIAIGKDVDRILSNLKTRSQYLEEIASSISPKLFKYLDFHIDQGLLNEIAYFYSKSLSSEIRLEKKTSMAEFQKMIEAKYKEDKFPIVPTVVDPILQNHLSKIDAKAVSMEKLSKFPREVVKEYASMHAYSSPSVAQKIRITFLGGGNIGNMGILVQHDNNAILMDFGMSVANNSIPRWHPALKYVKAVLVTHAHLDHTGGLPYLITPKNGKMWYATQSTKILTEKLHKSTTSIIRKNGITKKKATPLQAAYLNNSNIINLSNAFNPLTPNETVEVSPGFEVTPYHASHIFGSVGYKINVFGKSIFFTGDFSLDSSELFNGAKFPVDSDVTIFDGTYYNRKTENIDPNTVILQAAENCDRLIIPAFSVGRTQEMIRRLERLRVSTKKNIKTTGLAADVSKVMGIKGNYDIVKGVSLNNFEENDIVVTGHGMLQGGTARNLLDATKDDPNTGVLLCGYQAPNTLGFALQNSLPIAKQRYHQKVFSAPISGHTNSQGLNDFIAQLKGRKVMVHTPDNSVLRKEHKNVLIPDYNKEIVLKNHI
ncbi:MAG: MBL fold metallo-hydrolase [Candidatus Heimdallarchaeota archaeon]|nr:MBL fold metallo-hydrolase [Candidatus Heimdallarchaeota archaeon]